jgi:hypothetical protein
MTSLPPDPEQTTVPTAPPYTPEAQGANIDAHMPQPPATTPADVVFGLVWNPQTNQWAPSDEPIGGGNATVANQEPSHGDVPIAAPMSSPPPTGTTPDARANLLDSVKASGPGPAPVAQVHHVVETIEQGNDRVRARTIRVQLAAVGGGPDGGTVLLEQNPRRAFALIKLVTTNGVIIIFPGGQGAGNLAFTGVPTAPYAGFFMATGDPVLKIESSAMVSAIVAYSGTQAFCDVSIWEEMSNPSGDPGIGT